MQVGYQKDIKVPEGAIATEYNYEDATVLPGLVDCHTHLVFGGNRSKEFESRLRGETYEQIATSGGGIVSTMDATRSTSDEELEHKTWQRVLSLVAKGVTTIEIKSATV